MNVIKHGIEKVHYVEDIGDGFVKVNATTNSWGCRETEDYIFSETEWKRAEARGYFEC